jgi:methyl-accepting chemotaxis protein
MNMTRKRRTYLVDRSFQLKYALVLAAWGLLLAIVFGLWVWQAHEHVADLALRAPRGAAAAAVERSDRLLLWMLPVIGILSAAALGLVGFLMSHRIAGPVYVMGRDLRLLAQGHFPEQRSLRKGDELQNLFELFRHAVDALKVREERRTEMLEEVLAALHGARPRAPELAGAIETLEAEVRDRRGALAEAAAAQQLA